MSDNVEAARTWFITGVSTGLGRTLTTTLLARGERVIGTSRHAELLEDLSAAHPDSFNGMFLDLCNTDSIGSAVEEAQAVFGGIDVLVNNAGYGLFGAAEEVSDKQIKDMLDANVLGSIQVIRAILPHFRAREAGRILHVSSEGGITAYPNFSMYHAAKWALEGFCECLAQEVAPFNINVTLIEPGPTTSNFAAAMEVAPMMSEYIGTPAGLMRQDSYVSGTRKIKGDPVRTVQAMIDCATMGSPPLRLLLGSVAYTRARAALAGRIESFDNLREISCSADYVEATSPRP